MAKTQQGDQLADRIVALRNERAGYVRRGLDDRVAGIDAELGRLGAGMKTEQTSEPVNVEAYGDAIDTAAAMGRESTAFEGAPERAVQPKTPRRRRAKSTRRKAPARRKPAAAAPPPEEGADS